MLFQSEETLSRDSYGEGRAFSVSAIGSCRIVNPLKKAAGGGVFHLNQSGIYGYCHSSAEALQQVIHLQDGTQPPKGIRAITAPSLETPQSATPAAGSDLYFIELSSGKLLSVNGHPVQLNYLTRHFAAFFADSDRARAFWTAKRQGKPLPASLKQDDAFTSLSAADRKLLGALKMTQSTYETLVSDISALITRLPDVIFITHFDAEAADGTLLSARAEYLAEVRRALKTCQARWFDPSDYVAAAGQAEALADEGASLSHYTPEFERLLADNWVTRYIQPRRDLRDVDARLRDRIRKTATAAGRRNNRLAAESWV